MISFRYLKGSIWLKLNVEEIGKRGRIKEDILGDRIRRMLMRRRD